MNPTQGGTVTTRSAVAPPTATTDGCGRAARAESNPVARKRRMTEQPSSQTPKTPRRGSAGDEASHLPDFTLQDDVRLARKPPIHPDAPRKTLDRRDDSARLRKTIQWLEEGARKLREDLADARSELYEERKASRLARREIEVAVREARAQEAAKHQKVIGELKLRLAQSPSRDPAQLNAKVEMLREENHRREISVARKRLAEADETIRKLRSSSTDPGDGKKRRKLDGPDVRRLESELRCLREANKRLEEKLQDTSRRAKRTSTITPELDARDQPEIPDK